MSKRLLLPLLIACSQAAVASTNLALRLDGDADWMSVAGSPDLTATNQRITVACWVWMDSVTGPKSIALSTYQIALYFESQKFTADLGDAHRANSTTGGWDSNRWYHVAATYDGTTLGLYVDGGLAGSSTWTNVLRSVPSPFIVGAYRTEDIQFWNQANHR